MKNKKGIIILISILVLAAAALAVIHASTRKKVPEGAISVQQAGKETYVVLKEQTLVKVAGTIVNGKGEEKDIDADGIALSSLADGSFENVTVTADDEFSAVVGADEIENAWLIQSEDGTAQLVVFGDSNSKRAVRNVVRIEFE